MFYAKNLPGWERAARVIVGGAACVAAIAYFGPVPMGWALGGMGAMAAMSGLVGFCPACALAGRKLGN